MRSRIRLRNVGQLHRTDRRAVRLPDLHTLDFVPGGEHEVLTENGRAKGGRVARTLAYIQTSLVPAAVPSVRQSSDPFTGFLGVWFQVKWLAQPYLRLPLPGAAELAFVRRRRQPTWRAERIQDRPPLGH